MSNHSRIGGRVDLRASRGLSSARENPPACEEQCEHANGSWVSALHRWRSVAPTHASIARAHPRKEVSFAAEPVLTRSQAIRIVAPDPTARRVLARSALPESIAWPVNVASRGHSTQATSRQMAAVRM